LEKSLFGLRASTPVEILTRVTTIFKLLASGSVVLVDKSIFHGADDNHWNCPCVPVENIEYLLVRLVHNPS
jgi:hypothetical protein